MIKIKWKLRDFLKAHGTNPHALARAMGEQRISTLYRLTNPTNPPTRVDLPTLEAVIAALRDVTGEQVGIEDVLEVVEESSAESTQPDYLELAGIFDDPDSPGDVATRHDDYLGDWLEEDLERQRHEGER